MRENHPLSRRLIAIIAAACTLSSLAIVPAANAQDTPDAPVPQASLTQTKAAADAKWQKAIDDAKVGDTITLTGNVSENLTVKKKLTITAAPGAVYSGKLYLAASAKGSTVKGITFNRPENTPNPLERIQVNSLQLQGVSDVTVENNTFNSPSALYRGFEWQVNAVAVFANVENIAIRNNTFNLGRLNDANGRGNQAQDINSNVAVNLIGYSDNNRLKNVRIEGNTVNVTKPSEEATKVAPSQFLIANGGSSTITVKNNTFDGAADSGRAEFAGVAGASQVEFTGNTVKNAHYGMFQVSGYSGNNKIAKFKSNTFENVSTPINIFSDFTAVNTKTGAAYKTLGSAFDSADASDNKTNITLIGDLNGSAILKAKQTSVVDLWYSKVYGTITNNGNLTIKREGNGDTNLETGAVVTDGPAIVNKAGTTTIESGQFKSADGYALKAEGGNINVTGGFFSSREQTVSDRSAKGVVSISGGRFNVKPTDQELAKGYVAVQDGNKDYPAYPWTVEEQGAATATVNGKIAINPGVFHANEQFMFYVEKVQGNVELPSFEQNGVKYDSKTHVATLTLDKDAEWTTDDYPVTLNFANVPAGWYTFKVTAAGVSGSEDAQDVSAVEGKNSATVQVIVQDGQAHVSYFDAAGKPTDQLNFAYEWKNPAPKPQTFKVTFDSRGGSAVASQTVKAGEKATEPEAPTRAGYTFTGWTSDPEGANDYDFASPVTEDFTLYAQWQKNSTGGNGGDNGGNNGGSGNNGNNNGGTTVPSETIVDVERFYNPWSGEHFYTAGATEQSVLRSAGWRDEGVAFRMSSDKGTPVYRLYNPGGKHLFTTSAKERDVLIKAGWRDEGIAFYVPDGAKTDVHRLYNPGNGDHLLTTSANERGVVLMHKWRDEGIAFKAQ